MSPSSQSHHHQQHISEHVGGGDRSREDFPSSAPLEEVEAAADEHDNPVPSVDKGVDRADSIDDQDAYHISDEDDENSSLIGHSANDDSRRLLPPSISPSRPIRRFSLTEEDETRTDRDATPKNDDEKKPVSWSDLPNKGQLIILTLARLSEPLTQTSLQSYLFYQLKSFDPSLPDSTISAQAGILQGSFTAAQFLTAMWWGRLADAPWMGRKRVLLIGLSGTCISCLGFGFSRSFVAAAVFRTLGGVLNSNVGVMRTMIAEIIEEKKYQSRAFLLLPMCFNVGVIIGPILGGILADPVHSYPDVFGPGSFLGGKDGVWWMRHWPFALPNMLSACFIFASVTAVLLGLDETHAVAKHRPDWGRKLGKALVRGLRSRKSGPHYTRLHDDPETVNSIDLEHSVASLSAPPSPTTARHPPQPKRSPFSQIWKRNVLLTLLTLFLLAMHTSAFNAMMFVFLPTPRAAEGSRRGFFHFSGGLGLSSSRVGLATAIIGIIGLPLQIFVYPRVQFHLGTLRCFRSFLPLSPMAYLLMPFLVLIPRIPLLVWPAFTLVVALQVVSRTFALPAAIILVNNCVTDSTVLGTVHGIAQSISSGARTLGPFLGGWGLGMGLKNNIVGAVWWALAVEATLGWILTWTIYEGKGIERKKPAEQLPPEEVEEEERTERR